MRHRGPAFFFNIVPGVACSVCALLGLGRHAVEHFARNRLQARGPWVAIDKSRPPFRAGQSTPSPCEEAPDRRLHWFLIVSD